MLSVGDVVQGKYRYIVHKLVGDIVEFCITSNPCTVNGDVDVRESQTDPYVEEVDCGPY